MGELELTDDEKAERIRRQAENERQARAAAAVALAGLLDWAGRQCRAFPEDAEMLKRPAVTLRMTYDEHDGVFVLGIRDAEGRHHVVRAVNVDVQSGENFGRGLDALLMEALDAVPLPNEAPKQAH